MLSHVTTFLQSINWVDVALAALLVRIIFIGVKNGFIAEFFKCLGVLAAVFVSFHYYTSWAAWLAQYIKLSVATWEVIVFIALWGAVVLAVTALRMGLFLLFRVEPVHESFNKYAGGIVAVGRALLLCSLTIFALLLTQHPQISQQVSKSYGYKLAGKTAAHTYQVMFDRVVNKLFAGQTYNARPQEVLNGAHP